MDPCPSDDDLSAFLSGDGMVMVGVHLRTCPRCQGAVDRLDDDGSLRTVVARLADPAWDWSVEPRLALIVESLLGQTPSPGPADSSDAFLLPPGFLDPPETAETLGRLGLYDVEEEIGRGGMGVVFRARDRTTGRVVALKVLRAGSDDSRTRRRFIQEVRAAARVEHDHVVRLYATSDPEDLVPYFVMEYLSGRSLADRNQGNVRIDPTEVAEIVAQVASGLQAAHDAGLVHSDVKPANILLDPATGRAKIGDFGLARLAAEEPGITREGLLPGTPAYLSPEQARGELRPDPRSDVYSLGVTLYECLAGEPPFRGEPHRIIHQVLHDEPRPLRVFNSDIPRDLETICLKAMAKAALKRYPTASEFADDLRRFLKGEPILARPVGAIERGWRWCRNNRRVALLAAIAASLLMALAAGSTIAAVWISRERSRAVEHAARAEAQQDLTLDTFSSLLEEVQEKLASRPGTLELRRSLLEIARDGLNRLPREGTGVQNVRIDERLIATHMKIGDIELLLGRTAEAAARFDEAARLAERFSSANPKAISLRRDLASAYDRLGKLATSGYQDKDAGFPIKKAHSIRQALFAEHPENPMIRRDLRVSQGKLGDFHKAKKEFVLAMEYYHQALNSLLEEPQESDKRSLYLTDLRFIRGRIGYLAQEDGLGDQAIASFREALASAEALCSLDPENTESRRQRSLCLDYLGLACLKFGDLAGAERYLTAFRDDRKTAVKADPSNHDILRALGLAHQHLGNLATRRNDDETATADFLDASAIFDDLATRDPASVGAHKDRLIVLRRLMEMEATRNRFDSAVKWLDRELEIQSSKNVPPHSDHASWIDEAKFYRELYRLAPRAIEDRDYAKSLALPLRSGLLQVRAIALARAGQAKQAGEAASDLLALPDSEGGVIVAAHAYALIAKSLDEAKVEDRKTYVTASVAALDRLVRADRSLARHLEYDPNLESIRDDPRFKSLVAGESHR